MAKDPAFLFYSQDFLVGVATLTFEDRGKYITLLSQMHQSGRLDEETIRFLVGSVSDRLKAKFQIDGAGLWFNARLEKESAARAQFTESRRKNGLLGGRPTKNKPKGKPLGKPTDNLKVNHTVNRMEDENENENENAIKGGAGGKPETVLPHPSPEFRQTWDNWLAYRKAKKKPIQGEVAISMALKQMGKYPEADVIKMIEKAIANGWQGWEHVDNLNQKINGITGTKNQIRDGIGGDPTAISRTGFGKL